MKNNLSSGIQPALLVRNLYRYDPDLSEAHILSSHGFKLAIVNAVARIAGCDYYAMGIVNS